MPKTKIPMFESIRKNKTGIMLMILSSACVCIGQFLWKLSYQYGIWILLAGFMAYGVGALLMLYAYRFGKVSVLQPILSLNYVISMALAYYFLKEPISVVKMIGVVIIIFGVLMIVGGDEDK